MNLIETIYTDKDLADIEQSIFKVIITSSGFPKAEGNIKYFLPKVEASIRNIIDTICVTDPYFKLKDKSIEIRSEYINYFTKKYFNI